MFTIEMLPADHGDCLWLEYGSGGARHRVLIDGGPPYAHDDFTARLPADGVDFELLVVTHVDFDHIGGVLKLLARLPSNVNVQDVWFNGWDQLPGGDELGAKQGEMLSAVIERRALSWNAPFDGGAVCVEKDGDLPRFPLPGGLELTLLSPTEDELLALKPKWRAEVVKAGLVPGDEEEALRRLIEQERLPPDLLGDEKADPEALALRGFTSDDSEANGSSIVLLAEFEGKSCLLVGDAFPSIVENAIERLLRQRGGDRLRVDAVKLSHHGSKKNTNNALVQLLDCPRYLFSTNGAIYSHPHAEAVGRVIGHGGDSPTLVFNYRTPETEIWESAELQSEYGFRTVYPETGAAGVAVEL